MRIVAVTGPTITSCLQVTRSLLEMTDRDEGTLTSLEHASDGIYEGTFRSGDSMYAKMVQSADVHAYIIPESQPSPLTVTPDGYVIDENDYVHAIL